MVTRAQLFGIVLNISRIFEPPLVVVVQQHSSDVVQVGDGLELGWLNISSLPRSQTANQSISPQNPSTTNNSKGEYRYRTENNQCQHWRQSIMAVVAMLWWKSKIPQTSKTNMKPIIINITIIINNIIIIINCSFPSVCLMVNRMCSRYFEVRGIHSNFSSCLSVQ